jgi:hypothetical protein
VIGQLREDHFREAGFVWCRLHGLVSACFS